MNFRELLSKGKHKEIFSSERLGSNLPDAGLSAADLAGYDKVIAFLQRSDTITPTSIDMLNQVLERQRQYAKSREEQEDKTGIPRLIDHDGSSLSLTGWKVEHVKVKGTRDVFVEDTNAFRKSGRSVVKPHQSINLLDYYGSIVTTGISIDSIEGKLHDIKLRVRLDQDSYQDWIYTMDPSPEYGNGHRGFGNFQRSLDVLLFTQFSDSGIDIKRHLEVIKPQVSSSGEVQFLVQQLKKK